MRRLLNLDDARAHLESQGERVGAHGLGIGVPASFGERWPPGRVDVLWEVRPGLVQLYLALPFDVPEERRAAAALVFLDVNARLLAGSFILTPLPAFALAVFLDDDGALPARTLDRAIHHCRDAGQRYIDAIAAAVVTRAAPSAAPAASRITLGPDERERLAGAVERDWPSFAPRLGGPLIVSDRGQRWFRHHRVLEVRSPTPLPALSIHVAQAPRGEIRVLRGHPEHLVQVAKDDPPLGLDREEAALAYAEACDAWTTDAELGELRIESFDDVPWRAELTEKEREQARELRARLAGEIHPPRVLRTGRGFTVKSWVVSNRRLLYRELHVPPSGQVLRDERVWAENLGVPAGRTWALVGGRRVPTS
jgi:hypothetical protein